METHSAIKPMLWRTWIILVVGPLIGFLGVPAGAELRRARFDRPRWTPRATDAADLLPRVEAKPLR